MDYAFRFIIENGGIDTEADYPYNGLDGKCDPNRVRSFYLQQGIYIHTYIHISANSSFPSCSAPQIFD